MWDLELSQEKIGGNRSWREYGVGKCIDELKCLRKSRHEDGRKCEWNDCLFLCWKPLQSPSDVFFFCFFYFCLFFFFHFEKLISPRCETISLEAKLQNRSVMSLLNEVLVWYDRNHSPVLLTGVERKENSIPRKNDSIYIYIYIYTIS